MKKILKIFLGVVFIFALLLISAIILLGNRKPETKKFNTANTIAEKMVKAVNLKAWKEINLIQWTFSGRNSYLWDKKNNTVIYTSDNEKVFLNASNITGRAFKNGKELNGKKAEKLVKKAYRNFCNDSWWLNPIVKVYDKGVERSINKKANQLMVEYKTGGVTPGDSYLYKFEGNTDLPSSYLMWVKILPIKGLEVSFTDWVTLENGAKIATSHIINGVNYNIKITDLKIGNSFEEFGISNNPFNDLNVTKSKKPNSTQPKNKE